MDEKTFTDFLDKYGLYLHKLTVLGLSNDDIKTKYIKHINKFKTNQNKEIKQIMDVYVDSSFMCKAKIKEKNALKEVLMPINNLDGNMLVCIKDLEYTLRGKLSLIEDILQKFGKDASNDDVMINETEKFEENIGENNNKTDTLESLQADLSDAEKIKRMENVFTDENRMIDNTLETMPVLEKNKTSLVKSEQPSENEEQNGIVETKLSVHDSDKNLHTTSDSCDSKIIDDDGDNVVETQNTDQNKVSTNDQPIMVSSQEKHVCISSGHENNVVSHNKYPSNNNSKDSVSQEESITKCNLLQTKLYDNQNKTEKLSTTSAECFQKIERKKVKSNQKERDNTNSQKTLSLEYLDQRNEYNGKEDTKPIRKNTIEGWLDYSESIDDE